MENLSDGYHISFFKPTTATARYNRNIVVLLTSIWFVSIFGFQILLKVIEKPTPEAGFISFENAWRNIQSGTKDEQDLKDLASSALSVLGKIDITPEAKSALDNLFNWSVFQLHPETIRPQLMKDIQQFKEVESRILTIKDEEYVKLKNILSNNIGSVLGLKSDDVRRSLIPFELALHGNDVLTETTVGDLPGVMKKYMIHNQSFLTDFKFLGFPFHYFYTAIFLLTLFVGLCWIYCIKTDAMNKKLNIAD